MEASLLFTDRGMDAENVPHIHSGINSAINRNETVLFAEMWMNLETLIQSQEIRNTNTYMWNIEKLGIDEPICKTEIETGVENKCMDTKVAWWWDELGNWGQCVYSTMCKTDN